MKSPDRDAADDAIVPPTEPDWHRMAREYFEEQPGTKYSPVSFAGILEQALASYDSQSSELATLRRRVEEMEKALVLIGGYPHGSPLTAIGQIARAVLSPSTRKE